MKRTLQSLALAATLLTSSVFAQTSTTGIVNFVNASNSQLTVTYQICSVDINSNTQPLCSSLKTVVIPALTTGTPNANMATINVLNDPDNGKWEYVVVQSAKNDIASTQASDAFGITEAGGADKDAIIFKNFGTTTMYTQRAEF